MPHQQVRKTRPETRKRDPLPVPEQHGEGGSPAFEVENSPAEILHLQRTIGNQATNRLLQARRAPRAVIQRDGEGDATPALAPAPALDPAVAKEQFTALTATSLAALRPALKIVDNPGESAKVKPQLESARDQIQTKLDRLRTQPKSESVDSAIELGDSSLALVKKYITRIDYHIKSVEGSLQAQAAHLPSPAVWTEVDLPSSGSPAPSPAPAPAPAPPPTPTPAFVPGDPGITKADKAKRALAVRTAKKLPGQIEQIAGQDRHELAENASSHYVRSADHAVESLSRPPDPDGSKTTALFEPLKEAGTQVKAMAASAADKIADWLHPFLAFLDGIPGLSSILTVLTNGRKAYNSYGTRKIFLGARDEAQKRLAGKPSPSATDLSTHKSADYAYKKVNRAFWENLANFFGSLVNTIMHLITVLTGGMSALATETTALVVTVSKAVVSLGHKIKGGVKYLLGRRGKHRRENATQLYNNALAGDGIALKLLLDLKPFGTWEKIKAKLPGTPNLPATESAMLIYLRAHGTIKEQSEMIMSIADKMKST